MFKLFIVSLYCIILCVLGRPQPLLESDAKIVNYEIEPFRVTNGQGNYKFNYKTSNGIEREEVGVIPNVEVKDSSLEVRGFYSYVAPDGKTYTVYYVADENGYRAEADHLPGAKQLLPSINTLPTTTEATITTPTITIDSKKSADSIASITTPTSIQEVVTLEELLELSTQKPEISFFPAAALASLAGGGIGK